MPKKRTRATNAGRAQRSTASARRRGRMGLILVILIGVSSLALIVAGTLGFASPQITVPTPTAVPPPAGQTEGNPQASVVVEEWADYQCPGCKNAASVLATTLQPYLDKGQVKFVFHDLAFLGQESTWAAEAASCAADQGKFWQYHDALFARQPDQENSGAFTKANLGSLASSLGLDRTTFDSCLNADTYGPAIQAASQDAHDRGVTGAPTVLVNGTQLQGDVTADAVKSAVDRALGQS